MNDRIQGTKSEFTPDLEEIRAMAGRTWRSLASGWLKGETWCGTMWPENP